MKKLSTNEFTERARLVHGFNYSYEHAIYNGTNQPILITCPIHGVFTTTPKQHLRSPTHGTCIQCYKEGGSPKKLSTDEFILKAQQVHGNKYDYSKVKYTGQADTITIICKIHGEFDQFPNNHIRGMGCAQCAGKQITTEKFIARANQVHDNEYDYTKTNYTNADSRVTITCSIHGDFEMVATQHVNLKSRCPKCVGNKRATTEDFTQKATVVHGNKYDYSKVKYTNNNTKVGIICHTHGTFLQRPVDHTCNGQGCPSCGIGGSRGEFEIRDFIEGLGIETISRTKELIPPLEIDIHIPEYNLAIEYCGVRWHSEQFRKDRNYHKNKTNKCADIGIQLLTIFEDEWITKKPQIKKKIQYLVGALGDKKIPARKTKIVMVDTKTKRAFYEQNHIQGDGPGSIHLGLEYNEEMVACVSFIKHKTTHYLNRYATSCLVVGGFSKLVKAFQQNNEWTRIISFADRRWSTGNLYKHNGWTLDKTIPIDYHYTPDGKNRIHKFNYRRKNLHKRLDNFDPSKSEYQNCLANNVFRIWDCGKYKYVLDNEHKI